MSYFKKTGRPTDDESRLIAVIDRMIEQLGISPSEIPDCETLDDLLEVKLMLENDLAQQSKQQVDEPEPEEPEEQQEEYLSAMEEPLQTVESEPINEALPDDDSDFIIEDYDPFSDPIIERSYNKPGEQSADGGTTEKDELELEESAGSGLSDLNPATKRRAAEQTADAILKGYARLVPEPFKWLSKFPEDKIDRMTQTGELDVSIQVSDGTTFDEYMRQTNEQIDEIFEVSEDTLEEIKEPLVEVLMEQQLELTPQQRLMMAVVSHLVQMLTVALKLRKQNQRILTYQQHLTQLAHGYKVA